MRDFAAERARMVERQLVTRGIRDARVLDAMGRLARERFLPEAVRAHAYHDGPLAIGEGQTISQPYIVALMVEAAQIGPGDRVLEIGSGSGYAAAVMAELAARVFTVERHPKLAAFARERLASAGVTNVEIRTGDGTLGWPEAAPFEAIVVAAGGPAVPGSLKLQLASGGRLIMPVGDDRQLQRLVKVVRRDGKEFAEEHLGDVLFVPLIGSQGWPEQ